MPPGFSIVPNCYWAKLFPILGILFKQRPCVNLRFAMFLHFLAATTQRAQSEVWMWLFVPVPPWLSLAGTVTVTVARGHWAEPCSRSSSWLAHTGHRTRGQRDTGTKGTKPCPGQQPPLVTAGGCFTVFSAAELCLEGKESPPGSPLRRGNGGNSLSSLPGSPRVLAMSGCCGNSAFLSALGALPAPEPEPCRAWERIWWIKCLTLVVVCKELQLMCFSLADNWGEKIYFCKTSPVQKIAVGFSHSISFCCCTSRRILEAFWAFWLQFWILISVLFLGF